MSTFDRFDICQAYALYSYGWGGDGQDYENRIAVRLKAIGFHWGGSHDYTVRGLTENGREIYTNLVKRRHETVSGYVPCACCARPMIGTLVVSRACGQFPAGADVCFDCRHDDCWDEDHDACDECDEENAS